FGALREIFVPLVVVEACLDAGAQEQSPEDFAPDSYVNTAERCENLIRRSETFVRWTGVRLRSTDVCPARLRVAYEKADRESAREREKQPHGEAEREGREPPLVSPYHIEHEQTSSHPPDRRFNSARPLFGQQPAATCSRAPS